ncbi:mitochondrial small ribosomal subunit Rsm22-domain-containing protein [Crepidotus variabilis]|uniref:Mitochondrial small ribosomal subunit Rsm22-domain-containing protein n=1 Tax=Crepidotus variabilis TaxID=179855 RepID=A0A9P6EMQ4_9AGAR|nr:mitochondrial small ribosomal subunit Rsm22-domain-containing protein [Crepidotus variabilis]
MLSATRAAPRRLQGSLSRLAHKRSAALFSTSSAQHVAPKPRLDVDPQLDVFLQDIDLSTKDLRKRSSHTYKELQIVPEDSVETAYSLDLQEWSPLQIHDEPVAFMKREPSKSPAAIFGSNQIGAVVLPQELMNAIGSLISDSEKAQLHTDAKRLFLSSDEKSGEGEWDTTYDTTYRNRQQAARHAARDGTAFATVALPAHFSAITAVFHHAKQRLGPSWDVDQILDWGAATGSGLWASVYAFRQPGKELQDVASSSSIRSYTGIDKREGLTTIGRRIVNKISNEATSVKWQKSYQANNKLPKEDAPKTISLSAFTLTTLPSPVAQKAMVEEMWASGAHTIVLIDHDTPEGFKAIAHAREHLLELSKLEITDPEYIAASELTGCHVLAPCPHDRPCPLLHSGGAPLVCGVSQRLQRPEFVQKTKHSGVGHEDIHYSYVVIRRGFRPDSPKTTVGRVGGVGRRVLEQEQSRAVKELALHAEDQPSVTASPSELDELDSELTSGTSSLFDLELQEKLRTEAYYWPRLVFPALKKNGHIILDVCANEGKIMRMTIPKSQGKQPYYDARKSSWGDIFPHEPKNPPQERYQPKTSKKGVVPTGDDIGKRKELHRRRERATYENLADNLRENKKLSKKDFARIRGDKVWHDLS